MTKSASIAEAILLLIGVLLTALSGCTGEKSPNAPPEPSAFKLVSVTRTPGWAHDVYVYGDTAFVADGDQGVMIYDVSAFSRPVLTDTIKTYGSATRVRYTPEFNLLTVLERGIVGYDMVTETLVLSIFYGDTKGVHVSVANLDTLFVATTGDGFYFATLQYDSSLGWWIENTVYGLRPEPGFSSFEGFVIDANRVYLAQGQLGVKVYEVDSFTGDPLNITLIGSADTPDYAYDVALTANKDYLAVADGRSGLQMVAIADLNSPQTSGDWAPREPVGAFMVKVEGDTAYYLEADFGIHAADISDPHHPEIIANYFTGKPRGFFITPDHTIFIADEVMGLVILNWN